MTQLEWDAAGQRYYQFGVDRGVLYPISGDGVPWNGLTAVNETSDGGDIDSFYIDGLKYQMRASTEDFEASIEAFTYPDEFELCEGTAPIAHGLFITKQRRQPFGLCYRTKIGNDAAGQNLGYKIHLVYNAMVNPSDRSNATLGEKVDPLNFSWSITTRPPLIDGHNPSAHFVIDSRTTPLEILEQIEDILYGSADSDARQPPIDELVFIFEIYGTDEYDAGYITEVYYLTLDGGATPSTPQTSTVDGGTP